MKTLLLMFVACCPKSAYSGNCFGMGTFLKGHGDVLCSNRCIVGLEKAKSQINGISAMSERRENTPPHVGRFYGDCADSHLTMTFNEYYTPDGIVNIGCNGDIFHTMQEMQELFGLEIGSKGGTIPGDAVIMDWASKILCYQPNC
jgi:hypothetical protein